MSRTVGSLPCGAKIRFGAYCVGNEGAHDIRWIKMNSADTTFLAEYIEDFRAFDAKEPNNLQKHCRRYGNNRYSVSNIDQFLNSTEDDWYQPQHNTDVPPTDDFISDGTPYQSHPGFLAYFSEAELKAIVPTEIVIALPGYHSDDQDYEKITRKVFLPSRTNIFGRSVRNTNEDEQWEYFENGRSVIALVTQEATDNTELDIIPNVTGRWYWWLRCATDRLVGYVDLNGAHCNTWAYCGMIGVRPALKIDPEILVSDEPDEEGYYNVIPSIDDISEEDFLSILLG